MASFALYRRPMGSPAAVLALFGEPYRLYQTRKTTVLFSFLAHALVIALC
jgi:hypothetical protein